MAASLLLLLLGLFHTSFSARDKAASVSVTPISSLLPAGTTSLTLETNSTSMCRWDTSNVSFSAMRYNFSNAQQLAGERTMHATVPISPKSSVLNSIFIRCLGLDNVIHRVYRVLANIQNHRTPATGNLWGSYNLLNNHPLSYAASRVDLWLGAQMTESQAATLRELNNQTVILTSINACEHGDGLPEHYYLHNISNTTPPSTRGRLESWPGSYRLDVTKPEVQMFQAMTMYNLIVSGGTEGHVDPNGNMSLMFDGVFVDNVFLTQSWANRDIHGNPFYPDTTGTGKPDNLTEFDIKWRAGVLGELDLFLEMMPHALLDGHAMDINDPDIPKRFNAISIGFVIPEMVEGLQDVQECLNNYNKWMTLPRTPHITMIESAVRLQIGYGYGFDSQLQKMGLPGYIPKSTFQFSRNEFQYFRFGLAFTLLNDGYFTHELGDSWHGQDWHYDEEDFRFGSPLGNYSRVVMPAPPGTMVNLCSSSFDTWVNTANGCNATLSTSSDTPAGTSCSTEAVTILRTCSDISYIDLMHDGLNLTEGANYNVTFWAKASVDNKRLTINSRLDGPPWTDFGIPYVLLKVPCQPSRSLGLDESVIITTEWQQYSVYFEATHNISNNSGRLSFYMGSSGESLEQDSVVVYINTDITIALAAPLVLKRDYECGTVFLNGEDKAYDIPLGSGYKRLTGIQAPKYQYNVDDSDATRCSIVSGDWEVKNYDHGYNMKYPSAEENVGPYYHHWMKGCLESKAGGVVKFDLSIPMAGTYNVSLWWPRAVLVQSSWNKKMAVLLLNAGGNTMSSSVVDLTENGDVWQLTFEDVSFAVGDTLHFVCPSSGGSCVVDAVLVESTARLNDGSAVTSLSISAKDGAVLARDPTPPGC
eukprot:m.129397 g.129397  ORF g.129397 m.129397 type:complete len:871 (+) comp14576_c0_seq9:39-2651(+)